MMFQLRTINELRDVDGRRLWSWMHGLPTISFPLGAPDDEGGDVGGGGDDDDDDEDDGDGDDSGDGWTPPTKEAYEKLIASNRRIRKESVERKRMLEAAGLDSKTGKKPGAKDDGAKDGDSKDDPRLAESQSRADKAIRAAVRTALRAEHGIAADMVALALPQIDFDDLELGDDGEIDGLDDQVEALLEKYPSLRGKSSDDDDDRPRKPADIDARAGNGAKPQGTKKLTFTQELMRASRRRA